nr:MAG TPA: hypothetical protein [Caudoviricetes sp.]
MPTCGYGELVSYLTGLGVTSSILVVGTTQN